MQKILVLIACILVSLTFACKKDSNGSKYILDYTKSYNRWLEFKDSCQNSYSYQQVIEDYTGTGTETTITVRNGTVMERTILRRRYQYNGTTMVRDTFSLVIETGAQIGTHEGFPAMTLDELYKEAKSNWLQKRDDATTYFGATNNGMISTAGYVPNGCQDGCFEGASIRYIRPL